MAICTHRDLRATRSRRIPSSRETNVRGGEEGKKLFEAEDILWNLIK
jgi:hypothetical protein